MKYALATIGLVAAHPHPHHHHNHTHDHDWGMKEYHHFPNPLKWVKEHVEEWKEHHPKPAPKICDFKDGDRMADNIYFREIMGSMHNYGVKGWYREDAERPISEDCWGDWMDAEWTKVVNVHKKAKKDFWSVT